MKRISKLLSIGIILLSFASTTYASEINTKQGLLSDQKQEILSARKEALELAKEGRFNEIEKMPILKKYRKLIEQNPTLLNDEFFTKTDVANDKKVKEKLSEITVKNDETVIVEMEDSTFAVITMETKKNDSQSAQTLSSNGSYGVQYTTTSSYSIWNFPFDTVMKLNTTFTTSQTGITINSTDASGTTANFPDNISNISTSIIQATATSIGNKASSKGDYQYNLFGTNGVAISTRWYNATTNISLDGFDLYYIYYTPSTTWK